MKGFALQSVASQQHVQPEGSQQRRKDAQQRNSSGVNVAVAMTGVAHSPTAQERAAGELDAHTPLMCYESVWGAHAGDVDNAVHFTPTFASKVQDAQLPLKGIG